MSYRSRENLEQDPASAKEENLEMEKTILIEKELIEESIKKPSMTGEEWVKKNAKRFREIITKNPILIELWKKNKEKAKKEIKKLLQYT